MRHIADVLGREGVPCLEFRSSAVPRSLSLCFWERKNLVMMALTQSSRDVPVVKCNVSMVGQLLSVVSTGLKFVCCGGADSDFIKALDRDPTPKTAVQYPFTLSSVQVGKLMNEPSFSVMGKRNTFSVLWTLLVRLSGILDEPWAPSTRYLRKVGFIVAMFNSHVSMSFGLSGSCVSKALDDGSLDFLSACLLEQEMLSPWAQIVPYNSETGQRQDFQNVLWAGKFNYNFGTKLFVWFDVYVDDATGSGFRCARDRRRIFRMQTRVVQGNCAGGP